MCDNSVFYKTQDVMNYTTMHGVNTYWFLYYIMFSGRLSTYQTEITYKTINMHILFTYSYIDCERSRQASGSGREVVEAR